jgi:hypothetical protein
MSLKLLDGVVADTTGAAFELPMYNRTKHPNFGVFVWSTDFGGGTVTLQVSPDGVNWFTARTPADAQITTLVSDHFIAALRGAYVRAKLTGATAPAALSVWLF